MEWAIYFISTVDALCKALGLLAVFAMAGSVVGAITMFACIDTDDDNMMRHGKCLFKIAAPICIISALLAIFIPSSKTLAAMYVLPAIAKNEQLQNFAGNSLKALELLSKQWVKDLTPSDESHI